MRARRVPQCCEGRLGEHYKSAGYRESIERLCVCSPNGMKDGCGNKTFPVCSPNGVKGGWRNIISVRGMMLAPVVVVVMLVDVSGGCDGEHGGGSCGRECS